MREVFALALAKYKGLTLTTDVAREILRDIDADRGIDPVCFGAQTRGGYTLQCERLRGALEELQDQRMAYLAERHPDRQHDVNWLRLMDLARNGSLVIFTARDASDAMAASMWLHLSISLDTGAMRLTDDMLYVEPAHRGGMLAARLWRYAEECTFALGVREASIHMRSANGAESLARFAGYERDAIRFTKRHDGDSFADTPTRHMKGMT